jgi:hypothetical protein
MPEQIEKKDWETLVVRFIADERYRTERKLLESIYMEMGCIKKAIDKYDWNVDVRKEEIPRNW